MSSVPPCWIIAINSGIKFPLPGGLEGVFDVFDFRAALAGGTTPFARLELVLRARRGLLQVTDGRVTGLPGAVRLAGSVDLAGNTAALSLGLLPAVPDPPEIGVVLAGPLDALRRVPDLAAVARWRAGHAGGR